MSLVHALVSGTFVPMLGTLSSLLDKGDDYAKAKSFDPSILLEARLAPDMFPLRMQVQYACHQAKDAAVVVLGRPAISFQSPAEDLAGLKNRISDTVAYLAAIPASDFQGTDDRDLKVPLRPGIALELKGLQYVRDWSIPHFYFHTVTAYDILRHNGVELQKRMFVQHIAPFIRPAT